MTSIIPTFDFEVNDTPSRETLRQQALSLVITGVSISNLEAGLVGLTFGNTSEASDALPTGADAGSLWIDSQGSIWVKEQAGPVKLSRIEGGYESTRYFMNPAAAAGLNRPGMPVSVTATYGRTEDFNRSSADASSRTSGAPVIEVPGAASYDHAKNFRLIGITQDTAASAYSRFAVRGLTVLHDPLHAASTDSTVGDLQDHYRIARPSGPTGAVTYLKKYLTTNTADLDSSRWSAFQVALHPLSSVVSNANHLLSVVKEVSWAWSFGGPPMWTDRVPT